ncbi:hypothetical protein RhiLY_01447 [Ceratobasidium sp. AG-Ba]|nr:hypothetical protein RhiLY_01447 [Ceratobasidium sp. AG-Ba]
MAPLGGSLYGLDEVNRGRLLMNPSIVAVKVSKVSRASKVKVSKVSRASKVNRAAQSVSSGQREVEFGST